MTEENLNPQEEVTTTPTEGSESEEALDFEALFADDDLQDDVPVSREEFNALKKGVSKYFSQKGREEKAKVEPKVEPKSESKNDEDLTELFFAQKPEAELVEGDLKQIADSKYGGSILKAWKGESWLHEKAQILSEAKKKEEESKSKIAKPSSTVDFSKDIDSIKEEDVHKLTAKQKIEWLNAQVKKERISNA